MVELGPDPGLVPTRVSANSGALLWRALPMMAVAYLGLRVSHVSFPTLVTEQEYMAFGVALVRRS